MRKRRVMGLILVLTILIISTGCNQETEDPVLEAAVEMAYADFSWMKLAISGSEYIEMTEKHLIKPEIHYQEMVFGIDGVMYGVDDIKEFDEEELANLRESFYEMVKEYELGDLESMQSFFVSEVIDDANFSFKYVIARMEGIILGEKSYYFKKYTFKEDGDKWRVLTAKKYVDFIEEPRDPKMMQQYLEYNGKPIEYSREIELAK
jgi:hypothetical protein